jgi:hypothetical protein
MRWRWQVPNYGLPGDSAATFRVRHVVEREIPLGVVLALWDAALLIPAVVLRIVSMVEVNISCVCTAMQNVRMSSRVSMVETWGVSFLVLCSFLGGLFLRGHDC